jgi:heat shock protein 4
VERQTFEELAQPLLDRLQAPMERALQMAGLTKEQIESVEVIGGTTRIPAVKQRIGSFFGKEISTTLNQDECVSKGCALMVS